MSKKKTVGSAPEAVMDMNQFRTWLGLSDRLARELIKEPDFPAVMIHGRYRIFRSRAQQWLEEHYPVNARSEAIAEVMVGGNEND